jgi:hypothetical protein
MFMPKKPVSVTLEAANLLWLQGRMASRKNRSLSDALDEVLTRARSGAFGLEPARSVVGSVDLPADDPDLAEADRTMRALFAESLGRPLLVREQADFNAGGATPSSKRTPRKRRRG